MGGVLLYYAAVIVEDGICKDPEQLRDLINNFFKKQNIDAQAHIETVFNRSDSPENSSFVNPKKGIIIISTEIKAMANIINYLADKPFGKITISNASISPNKTLDKITDEDIEQSLESYENVDANTKFDSCGNKLDLEIILTQ